ncbi:acyl-CoA dehydrogenase [Variovorax dokdonensis]|uniref:Acyl-CoA dehydrogenase n=2 Tax=Variovorax dokdonensis TaxID=344883 RepID=A0ABT7NH47_9BURK|nr:acyl-CoA dehydrogenase [Variovorax dokdonensis]MDM0047165.1 acyl-CoA dehydrogenase [Variovorax dokdonensis]
MDRLPPPGSDTLGRWRMLAAVAAVDLSLVKLYEGHTDALAILGELDGPAPAQGSRWGTWCAEPRDARVELVGQGPGGARLWGTKAWCSGAGSLTHAVVSCWNAHGEPCLAAVALDQPGVHVTRVGWEAVGMAGSASVDVRFENAVATPVGRPGTYVARPGFWQGGAGIAACWWGGAAGLVQWCRDMTRDNADPHRLAHRGAMEVALDAGAAVLREAAAWIDAHPQDDAQQVALRVRAAVELSAEAVMRHAGRAFGATPLCRDARFARRMADLPVFLRQGHAERDLATLGRLSQNKGSAAWLL